MDLQTHKSSDVRILLVGQTGHGKSSLGNSLLGSTTFIAKNSPKSVTKKVQREIKLVSGRRIEIVDSPGLEDVHEGSELALEELTGALVATIPGFNAVFFVIAPNRFTVTLEKSVVQFLTFFGDDVNEFAFLVFTNTPHKQNLNEYLEDAMDPTDIRMRALNGLIDKCGQKVLYIDNRSEGQAKTDQVNNIFSALDDNLKRLKKPYYTNKMFEFTVAQAEKFNREQKEIKRQKKLRKEQAIREEEKMKCDLTFKTQRLLDAIEQEKRLQIKEQTIRCEEKKKMKEELRILRDLDAIKQREDKQEIENSIRYEEKTIYKKALLRELDKQAQAEAAKSSTTGEGIRQRQYDAFKDEVLREGSPLRQSFIQKLRRYLECVIL